jgi:outer membrane receptor for ferric coprogen and ferric-rhodotorulic acid
MPGTTTIFLKSADQFDPALEQKFSGDTKTLGLVGSPLNWLALTYNRSEGLQPQSQRDMVGRLIGPRSAKGQDYGVRLSLLSRRLYMVANRYQTNDLNQQYSSTAITNMAPAINAVLGTLTRAGDPLPAKFANAGATEFGGRDRVNNDADGYEVEIVGRITKNWSISLNCSRSDLRVSNVAADLHAFLAEVQPDWQNNARTLYSTPTAIMTYVRTRDNTPGRDFNANPATFNDAYETAQNLLNELDKQNGQAPLLHVRDSLNLFTSYRFDGSAPALLKRARVGIGAQYRSARILGYDDSPEAKPYKGDSDFTMSLMLGRVFPFKKGRSLDIQLNISNLFNNDDLLAYAVDPATGETVRWIYPRTHRSFDLRMIYNF